MNSKILLLAACLFSQALNAAQDEQVLVPAFQDPLFKIKIGDKAWDKIIEEMNPEVVKNDNLPESLKKYKGFVSIIYTQKRMLPHHSSNPETEKEKKDWDQRMDLWRKEEVFVRGAKIFAQTKIMECGYLAASGKPHYGDVFLPLNHPLAHPMFKYDFSSKLDVEIPELKDTKRPCGYSLVLDKEGRLYYYGYLTEDTMQCFALVIKAANEGKKLKEVSLKEFEAAEKKRFAKIGACYDAYRKRDYQRCRDNIDEFFPVLSKENLKEKYDQLKPIRYLWSESLRRKNKADAIRFLKIIMAHDLTRLGDEFEKCKEYLGEDKDVVAAIIEYLRVGDGGLVGGGGILKPFSPLPNELMSAREYFPNDPSLKALSKELAEVATPTANWSLAQYFVEAGLKEKALISADAAYKNLQLVNNSTPDEAITRALEVMRQNIDKYKSGEAKDLGLLPPGKKPLKFDSKPRGFDNSWIEAKEEEPVKPK